MLETDYLIEKRLKKLDPRLHDLIAESTTALVFTLEKYKHFFPDFTDHSIAHALNVLDFVNRLVGKENIDSLNADELYVLIMGAYLHDSGMGISENDFEKAKETIIPASCRKEHPEEDIIAMIRKYHHELSGFFVEKYHSLFEIPSPSHVFAISSACKGHRVTDLYDEASFPRRLPLENGNTVCVPYIAALIRLADEMDIAEDRIFAFDYPETDTISKQIHHAIKTLEITGEELIYFIDCEASLQEDVVRTVKKMETTFLACRKVIEERTPFHLNQKRVTIKKWADRKETEGGPAK